MDLFSIYIIFFMWPAVQVEFASKFKLSAAIQLQLAECTLTSRRNSERQLSAAIQPRVAIPRLAKRQERGMPDYDAAL